jgi:hypothetical protein
MLAGVYPTACRGRALGVNLTIGRVGSILGPSVTGWLLLLQIPPQQVLLLAAVPALIAAVSLYVAADSIRRLAQLRRAAGG